MKDVWTPFAPCSFDELLAYLHRDSGQKEADTARIIRAGNHALGYMELRTSRHLVARTYREPVAIASCATTLDDADVTGAGFTAGVKVGDEVVGVGLQPSSRVASVTSDTALVLDRPAFADGTVTLTFGSERLIADGTASQRIYVPERPVREIYSAAVTDSAGVETALDLTGMRLDKSTGLLILPNDFFPDGELNILVACSAGYAEPSSTDRGDFGDWTALQHCFLRIAQIYFQDEEQQPGRVVDRKVLQAGATLPDFRLPQDVEDLLIQFERSW